MLQELFMYELVKHRHSTRTNTARDAGTPLTQHPDWCPRRGGAKGSAPPSLQFEKQKIISVGNLREMPIIYIRNILISRQITPFPKRSTAIFVL